MAKQQIDELFLDIDIDVEKGIDKRVSSLARAIDDLNRAVKNTNQLGSAFRKLKSIGVAMAGATANTGVAKVTQTQVPNRLETQEVIEGQMSFDDIIQDADKLKTTMSEASQSTKDLTNEVEKVKKGKKHIKDLGKETGKAGKQASKSAGFFGKFVKSIGRIALYRAIRSSLSAIAKLAKEGFQNFVQFDSETNQAMSNIQSSLGQLGNTLGATLGTALQSVEPILTTILDGVTGLVDNINMAMSAISGKNTYKKAIKQNEDYAKSLEKTKGTLLSFDKFEALNSGDEESSPSEMFEEVPLPEDMGEAGTFFADMFKIVKEILPYVKELIDMIMPIIQKLLPKIADLIKAIWEAIQPVLDIVILLLDIYLEPITDAIGSIIDIVIAVVEQIKGAFQFVSGLLKLLTGDFDGAWEDIANGFANMVNGIANMFVGLVNFIIDLINTILAPFDYILEKIGVDITIPHWDANVNWQPYAEGGTFEKGSRFIAGEAGAEIVYNNRSGGGGGVANIEQIAEAQFRGTYQALTAYGASRGDLSNLNGMAVVIDDKIVGRVIEGAVYNEGVRVGHFSRA